jgi:hypothetical protein
MKTITVKVYSYDELSDEAKEKAREWYRSGNDYPWYSECQESLKGFENALPIKIKDWSYGEDLNRSYINWYCTNENLESLTGLRLRTWLINNFWNLIEKGKYQSTAGTYDADGKYHYKKRYSNCTKEVIAPFTGYIADDILLGPIRDFIKKPDYLSMDFKTLIDDCFYSFMKSVADDIEYQNEDEQIAESIRTNEYEFTEDGEIN